MGIDRNGPTGAGFRQDATTQNRIEHKTTNGPLDRHEGARLMVTETNNEACAQLQLVLHALLSQHASRHKSNLAPVGPFLSIPTKLTAGDKPQICV